MPDRNPDECDEDHERPSLSGQMIFKGDFDEEEDN
ncbi:hypothetical protein SAMN05216559_2303 [Halomicrobium zhouii]|uniref:Uncharacterized protein n=1 Tax=Halomicrobium zhouii TaxID=767519 RepID=A0A1I6L9D4_9EURY|nr:hypothetical protein SAMN05216559_2303 [Halomicrobium zhouii]